MDQVDFKLKEKPTETMLMFPLCQDNKEVLDMKKQLEKQKSDASKRGTPTQNYGCIILSWLCKKLWVPFLVTVVVPIMLFTPEPVPLTIPQSSVNKLPPPPSPKPGFFKPWSSSSMEYMCNSSCGSTFSTPLLKQVSKSYSWKNPNQSNTILLDESFK